MTNYGREHLAFLARRAEFLATRIEARSALGAQASLDAAERDALVWAIAEAGHLDEIAASAEDAKATPLQRLAAVVGLLKAREAAHSAAIGEPAEAMSVTARRYYRKTFREEEAT